MCVGVKVGYSLLLGHVANPLTLAWILLTDPFSSNKHTSPWRWRPPGLGYRCQSARAARRSFHIVATLKQPPSSSSRHPTDVFFCGLSPNAVLVTTVIIIIVAVVSEAEKGLSSVEPELRRKPSDAPPTFQPFGRPGSCWQKQPRRLHLRDTKVTLDMSPRLRPRAKVTWRRLQSVFVPRVVQLYTVGASFSSQLLLVRLQIQRCSARCFPWDQIKHNQFNHLQVCVRSVSQFDFVFVPSTSLKTWFFQI